MENSEDFILIENIDEDEEDREPVFGIYAHKNGELSFSTPLKSAVDALWLIKQIEMHLLETIIGPRP